MVRVTRVGMGFGLGLAAVVESHTRRNMATQGIWYDIKTEPLKFVEHVFTGFSAVA